MSTSNVGGCADDEFDKTVSVVLNGEETILSFIDTGATTLQDHLADRTGHEAFILVYSITDHASFQYALEVMCDVRQSSANQLQHVVIVVANKSDLVRTRQVSETEGKCACTWLDCKYIEVSASLNHRVDELLIGIVRQIRLSRRRETARRNSLTSSSGGETNVNCVRGAKEMIREFFKTDMCAQPSSDCENLFI